jgi:hypothetical protein
LSIETIEELKQKHFPSFAKPPTPQFKLETNEVSSTQEFNSVELLVNP